MMIQRLPAVDKRVATGLAGTALVMELIAKLCEIEILTEDEALTMFTGAAIGLGQLAETAPHPSWHAAQDLLRRLAMVYGGPDPHAKPS
jgi:hypothetical protein